MQSILIASRYVAIQTRRIVEAVLSELAESEAKSHNYDEALEVLKGCQPSVVQKALSADCYINKGDVATAIGIVNAGLEDAPNEMTLLELKGRCLLHQGDLQAATQAFEAALIDKAKRLWRSPAIGPSLPPIGTHGRSTGAQ